MPFPQHLRTFGTETVTIIHAEGTEDETRTEVEAHIQPKSGFFAIETPIYEGDVVERKDPRGGTDRRLAQEVNIYDPPGHAFTGMQHTEVVWGKAPTPRIAPVRRIGIQNLHDHVVSAAHDLFADGHAEAAVGEAVKSLEVRVRKMIGSKQSGTKLMGEAFGGSEPLIRVSSSGGQSASDEQEGFLAIFRGVMLAVRNPRAHDVLRGGDPQVALEYLGLVSLLHRRLDEAQLS